MLGDFSTKEKRPEIDPKPGFLDQLRSLEDDLGENRNWLLKLVTTFTLSQQSECNSDSTVSLVLSESAIFKTPWRD